MSARKIVMALLVSIAVVGGAAFVYAAELNDVIGVLPKFAIPMR